MSKFDPIAWLVMAALTIVFWPGWLLQYITERVTDRKRTTLPQACLVVDLAVHVVTVWLVYVLVTRP